jgi:hypothetical protein
MSLYLGREFHGLSKGFPMSVLRSASLLTAATLLFGGALVTPAAAAEPVEKHPPAPACVNYKVKHTWKSNTATVTNNCTYDVRVRFNWDMHVDGPCASIGKKGGSRWESVPATSAFQGVYSC